MNIVYSAGYQNMNREAFAEFVRRNGIKVADVRLKPVSRNHVWNKNALLERLVLSGYVHIPDLGNLNYKGGPIVLKDEAAGLLALRALLTISPVVVLCVCADPMICHRTVITDKLTEFKVRHLYPRDVIAPVTAEPSLID